MKRIILVSMFFLIFMSFMSLNAQWARTYGGSDNDVAHCIQQTSDGGYIAAGYTYSFGAGEKDIWILKLDKDGGIEWQKAYGGSFREEAKFIQQTSDGGYIVVGSFTYFGNYYTIWILKLDLAGDIEWQRKYTPGWGGEAYSIQQTSDGGYIVAGYTGDNALILKLSSSGDIDWDYTFSGSDKNVLYSIQQTSDGRYIAAGYLYDFWRNSYNLWIIKLNSDGSIYWQKYWGPYRQNAYAKSIQQTSDGGYIIAGSCDPWDLRYRDAFILKISSSGEYEWRSCPGGEYATEEARYIQQTSDGGYIVAVDKYIWGIWGDNSLIFKFSSSGSREWVKSYDDISVFSIQQTTDGGYIVAGSTSSSGAGMNDLLVLKLDSDGDIDPSCGFIETSHPDSYCASLTKWATLKTLWSALCYYSSHFFSTQDTDATVNLICEAHKYTLTISTTTGGTTGPSPGNYAYKSETEVAITAIPDDDYRFSGWTGVPSGQENDNPVTITMDSDKSITANFIRQYTLTIAAGTNGTTNPSSGSYTHDSGASVSVTAIPNSGYQFSNWSGDASGTTNPITITMDGDKSVTANFSVIPPPPPPPPKEPEKKGGCFIATAAYGSFLHPHVKILRDFRNTYLMPSKFGRKLVSLYYKYSPFIADLIAKHKALMVAVRIMLMPLVAFSYSMVHFNPTSTLVMLILIFGLPISFAWFLWRERR